MHTHTIFSDGNVWPTTRVDEAILDGLDFFVITDHLDGRHQKLANKGLFNCDRDESYRLAAAYAKSRDILVIHGGEITRGMPPGHFNVSFVDSDTKIGEEEDKFEDHFEGMVAGLKEARKQGAFMVWNHPHWSRQAPNGPVWYDEHSRILDMGLMHGLEVFNQFDGFSKEEEYGAASPTPMPTAARSSLKARASRAKARCLTSKALRERFTKASSAPSRM